MQDLHKSCHFQKNRAGLGTFLTEEVLANGADADETDGGVTCQFRKKIKKGWLLAKPGIRTRDRGIGAEEQTS
jgi:hypothetical protein